MNLSTYNEACDFIHARPLSSRQGRILTLIHENPDLSLREISQRIHVTQAAMTGQIDRLEERGYLKRNWRANADRRWINITIIDAGRAYVQRIIEAEEPICQPLAGPE